MRSIGTDIDSQKAQKMLEEVGLTETEARIYLAGLEDDVVTVQELLAKTSIKRPTIYHALHTLGEKGLVVERDGSGKSGFTMQQPARLLGWLDAQKDALTQKEDAVQSLVAQLAARIPSSGASDVQVAQYTDMKSMQAVFDLTFYARSKKCMLLISKELLSMFDPDGARVKDAEARGIEVRIHIKKVESAVLVYDEKVVICTSASNATVLSSPSLASALSALF